MNLKPTAGMLVLIAAGCSTLTPPPAATTAKLYLGADLSYVNEMEDCGAVSRKNGQPVDAFRLFASEGANLNRVRIWNDAKWTRYSNLADVRKTISRAKAAGMQTLLDFHYSDDWADGKKQLIPEAWKGLNHDQQAKALYDYTREILRALDVYWEPAWVSTGCSTRWSTGSNWDNATFFDFRRGNEALPALEFFRHPYGLRP